MKKNHFLKNLIFRGGCVALCFFAYNVMGQTVIRQCISSYATSSSNGLVTGQTVGQSYSTQSLSHTGTTVLQGFQQPETFLVEEIDVESIYDLDVKVYPNPATHRIAFKTLEQSDKWSVNIYDAKGAQLSFESPTTLDEFEVACDTWQKGVYLMKISNGKTVKTLKVLIEK